MANLAAEARALVQAKYPGATVIERGRGFIRHQHPTDPEREIFQTQVGPMHYGTGEDQEIDTAWVSDTTDGFTNAMTANDFVTRVRADQFNAGDIFRFEAAGEWLRFDPQSINWIDENTSRQQIAIKQNVTGAFNDDTVMFTAAYGSGIDFSYQNQTAKLQKLIVIDNFSTLPTPTVQGNDVWFEAEFSLSLSSGINFWIDGVEWARSNGVRVQTADRIEIRDAATGTQVLWHLDYPRAKDSGVGNERKETIGQMEVRRQGGPNSLFICVRIPYDWMAAATYPIKIDPTVDYQVGAGADDAYESLAGSVTINGTSGTSDNRDEWLGFRWAVTIPNGATIDAMTVDIAIPHNSLDEPEHEIRFEDGLAPGAFTTGGSDISGRTYTTAYVDWGDGTALGVATGAFFSTATTLPELKTIGQELVDSYDYSSGSHMVCAFRGQVGIAATSDLGSLFYENDSADAAKLHIEYSTGADYTLTLTGAGVAVADTTVSLLYNRSLSITVNDITVADTTVGLLRGYSLPIAVNDVAVATGAVGLLASRTMPVTVADIAVTTDAVGLLRGYALPITVGDVGVATDTLGLLYARTFGITGIDVSVATGVVGLLYGRALALTVGDVTVATGTIDLVYSGAGAPDYALTLTGADIATATGALGLLASRTLGLTVADVTTSGQALGLLRGYALPVTVADVAVGTNATSLFWNRVLSLVAADILAETGTITLDYSGSVAPVTPDSRTYIVPSESRTFVIGADGRVYYVLSEDRTYEI